jgi:hypothetical protein
LILLLSIAFLAGCQGLSAGSPSKSSQPPPVGNLSLANSSMDFGSVVAGTTKTLTVTATNSGSAAVTVNSATVPGNTFSVTAPVFPLTIAAGQSASLSLAFTPNAVGSFNATVTITSNASNSTATISLSGTGIGPGQLSPSPSSESFGSVTVGGQQTVSEKITNTGGTSLTISQAATSGAAFSLSGLTTPTTLSAGQSTTFTVAFAPTTTGSASGSVTLTSNGSNPTLTIPLSGTGIAPGQVAGNPSSQAFGSVNLGNQQTASETITNGGGTSVSISRITASGSGFSLSGISAPVTLSAGQSVTFTIAFTPQSAGTASGNVQVTSNASNPTLNIPLSGTGNAPQAGQLAVTPSTLALGTVTVGQSGTASGSLTASGGSVTVTAASTNNSAFSVGGISLPLTIQSGQSAQFTITFSPQTAAAATATLTITSNGQSPTTTETLTGTGTPAPTHLVNLSWTASTTSDVVSYNVYRALYSNSACGAFAKINPVPNTTTLYTDSTVASSAAYCYATTAVDSTNAESAYSNIVSDVAIP